MEVDRADLRRWGRYANAVARWTQITGRVAPEPALLSETTKPRPAPPLVEWLMGLPLGWVTRARRGLTANQQLATLGNGVQPLQAATALASLLARIWRMPSAC